MKSDTLPNAIFRQAPMFSCARCFAACTAGRPVGAVALLAEPFFKGGQIVFQRGQVDLRARLFDILDV